MSVPTLKRTKRAPCRSTRAFAKINLTLDVLGPRGDGFHELRSLAIGVDLTDKVRLREVEETGIHLECAAAGLAGPDNLVVRAAQHLADLLDKNPALRIELEKAIPVAAGLGGGSSDAAATLSLLNELWGACLDQPGLSKLGAELGSDVPLFFALPGAIVGGRGERVRAVDLAWSGWVVLVHGGVTVSTAAVYRAWRPGDARTSRSGMSEGLIGVAKAADLGPVLSNHLEQAVFRVCPEVARMHRMLTDLGAAPVRVSGAGSALFMLFDDHGEACEVATSIHNLGMAAKTWVLRAPVGHGHRADEES